MKTLSYSQKYIFSDLRYNVINKGFNNMDFSILNKLYTPRSSVNVSQKRNDKTVQNQYMISSLRNSEIKDSVCFTGKSLPSMYSSVFDYLAAEVLGSQKKYKVDGSMLSATNIGKAVTDLVESGKLWGDFKKSQVSKIRWKSYIPQDIREYSINKINMAREVRLSQWRKFLQNPEEKSLLGEMHNPQLVEKIKNNDSLRLVIWNAVTSEIKDNNRHIPVPFNEKALLETINGFEIINPKDRAVRCAAPSFLEIYTHRLRDNLLMDLNLSDNEAVWVKIPSIKHDPEHKEANIAKLETLSCKNWCTRSSVDKAEDALTDGDFYIYLERGKFNLWEPLVGMTSARGQIDQIQGVENNNIVPLSLVGKIKTFIEENKLKCRSGIEDEGPKSSQAIMISEKLNEVSPISKKSFAKAIKDNDSLAMFEFLGVKAQELEDGTLVIEKYKPSYTLNSNSGISIPYSMFGLDEDMLLQNVRKIDGDLVLSNKNFLFGSRISKFPPNLEEVTGKVICSAKQFENFKDVILKVVDNNPRRILVQGK